MPNMMTASKGMTAGAEGAQPEPTSLVQEVLDYQNLEQVQCIPDEPRRGSKCTLITLTLMQLIRMSFSKYPTGQYIFG